MHIEIEQTNMGNIFAIYVNLTLYINFYLVTVVAVVAIITTAHVQSLWYDIFCAPLAESEYFSVFEMVLAGRICAEVFDSFVFHFAHNDYRLALNRIASMYFHKGRIWCMRQENSPRKKH